MDFEKLLQQGVEKEIISLEQKNNLLNLAQNFQQDKKETSSVVKFLYYLGGFIMFFTMCSLMTHTIQNGTYYTILALGTVYAIIFLALGELLWKKDEKLPAGIMYFLFVTAFSLIFMDIEKMTGFFPHFSDMYKYDNFLSACRFPTITLSIATLIVNGFLIKHRPTSILAIPIICGAYTIYFIMCEWFFGLKTFENKITIHTTIYSTILLAVAFWKDRLTKVDYSKWFYLFGCFGIFYAVCKSFIETNNLSLSICVLGIIFSIIGFLVQRKFITIIGLLSIIQYIFIFEGNHITSGIALTSARLITGLILLCIGVLYSQNIEKITTTIENIFPDEIKKYLPRNRK